MNQDLHSRHYSWLGKRGGIASTDLSVGAEIEPRGLSSEAFSALPPSPFPRCPGVLPGVKGGRIRDVEARPDRGARGGKTILREPSEFRQETPIRSLRDRRPGSRRGGRARGWLGGWLPGGSLGSTPRPPLPIQRRWGRRISPRESPASPPNWAGSDWKLPAVVVAAAAAEGGASGRGWQGAS